MVWIHGIAEHSLDIQNPLSPEKLRLLGERLCLRPGTRVLDLGAGRGGPALVFASEFGCRLTCVEAFPGFVAGAKQRARRADVADQIEYVQMDASKFVVEPGAYDVGMCLGASFIFGGLSGTLDALKVGVRDGGHLVVGECFRHLDRPLPDWVEEDMQTLRQVLAAFEERRLPVVAFIRSSQDDWDRYVTGRIQGIQDWLDANPDHPEWANSNAFAARSTSRISGMQATSAGSLSPGGSPHTSDRRRCSSRTDADRSGWSRGSGTWCGCG